MCDRYLAGGPIADRPRKTPCYGLGLMIGETTGGELIAGHTGGGAGSAVGDDAALEGACVTLLRTCP